MERDLRSLRQLGQAIAEQQDAALRASANLERVAHRLLTSVRQEDLRRLGRQIAQAQDATLGQRPWLAAQARSARTRRMGGHGTSTWHHRLVLGLASGALAVLLVWLWRPAQDSGPAAPSFLAEGRRGQLDTAVSPPEGRSELTLRFSDGAAVQLRRRAVARVRHLDRRGAVVALVRGAAAVAVPHRARTRWTLEAGPFTVHVVGTRFRLDWSPEARLFHLDLLEGRVVVEGPVVSRVALGQGQSLTIEVAQRRLEVGKLRQDELQSPVGGVVATEPQPAPSKVGALAPAAPAPSVAAAPAAALRVATVGERRVVPATPLDPAPEPNRTPPSPGDGAAQVGPAAPTPALEAALPPVVPPSAGGSSPAWRIVAPERVQAIRQPVAVADSAGRQPPPSSSPLPAAPSIPQIPDDAQVVSTLLADGMTDAALERAMRASWPTVLERTDRGDLRTLADAARFARGTAFANAAYIALRRRFPGTDEAALAALSLGRLVVDQRRDYAGAVRWIELFLNERPRSPLAPVAAGRLLEAFVALGARERACAQARSFVAQFPGGPYQGLARDVLRTCPPPQRAASRSR
ncbi:MAG: FecR domain-containing protein [Proteobacteria bacterium]|nr:FecR domain-containing protein [Pseudomonadota bacterium]